MDKKFTFSTGALYPLHTAEALNLVKSAGFDGAELMPQAISDVSDDSIQTFSRIGLPIYSIHFPLALFALLYTHQPDMIADGTTFTKQLLKLGHVLGTRVLVVHPHTPSSLSNAAQMDALLMDNLRSLADLCADKHIVLAMENSPKTCATSERLLDYVALLKHLNIKPMVDTTEVCEAGGDPAMFLSAVNPCHLHLSDFGHSHKHLPIGEGDIDWQAVKAALAQYQGLYTVEPSYRYYLSDIPQKLAKANQMVRSIFQDQSDIGDDASC